MPQAERPIEKVSRLGHCGAKPSTFRDGCVTSVLAVTLANDPV
jgi:hypothetical protein